MSGHSGGRKRRWYRAPWFVAAALGATVCAAFEAAWFWGGVNLFNCCAALWPSSILYMGLEAPHTWRDVALVTSAAVGTNVLLYATGGALLGALARSLRRRAE